MSSRRLCNDQLLLLLQALGNIKRNLQSAGDNARRRQSQPLRQRYIHYAVALVDLDPRESLVRRSVLNVMARVIWKDSCVACREIEGTSGGLLSKSADCLGREACCENLHCQRTRWHELHRRGSRAIPRPVTESVMLLRFHVHHELTLGCQWSSLSAPGFRVTIDEAMVFATGKLRESTVLTVPPPPGATSASTSLALNTYEPLPSSLPNGESTLWAVRLLLRM